jgi:hypothetical protein
MIFTKAVAEFCFFKIGSELMQILSYVLCANIFHEIFNFIQIGPGHTVYANRLIRMLAPLCSEVCGSSGA